MWILSSIVHWWQLYYAIEPNKFFCVKYVALVDMKLNSNTCVYCTFERALLLVHIVSSIDEATSTFGDLCLWRLYEGRRVALYKQLIFDDPITINVNQQRCYILVWLHCKNNPWYVQLILLVDPMQSVICVHIMPERIQAETLISLVAPSDNIQPFIYQDNTSQENPSRKNGRKGPKITVRANSSTNLLSYNTTISLRGCESNTRTQKRNVLDILVKITDVILIIGAVVIAISMIISFMTVGLAVYKMYFTEGVAKINNTRKNVQTLLW